ncbi:MAG: DUF4157 domain-containing protein, partial [Dehalococcoidia bacterium]
VSTRIEIPAHCAQSLERWYGALPLEVRVLRGSFLGWLFGLTGQHGVTVNSTVHWTRHAPPIDSEAGTVLLGHELFHVLQQQEMGWLRFLAGYLRHWRPRHVERGWEHPYEVSAYQRGREIREALKQA